MLVVGGGWWLRWLPAEWCVVTGGGAAETSTVAGGSFLEGENSW